MNKNSIVILSAVMGLSMAHAALDETQQQIEQRYGAPTKVETATRPATSAATYESSGVKIYVAYIGGRVAYKKYTGFDSTDVENILKANVMGTRTWIEVETSTSDVKRKRSTTSTRLRMMASTTSASQSKRSTRYWILQGQAAEATLRGSKSDGYTLEFATDQWLKAKSSGF